MMTVQSCADLRCRENGLSIRSLVWFQRQEKYTKAGLREVVNLEPGCNGNNEFSAFLILRMEMGLN